jgi:hypothetical protein
LRGKSTLRVWQLTVQLYPFDIKRGVIFHLGLSRISLIKKRTRIEYNDHIRFIKDNALEIPVIWVNPHQPVDNILVPHRSQIAEYVIRKIEYIIHRFDGFYP